MPSLLGLEIPKVLLRPRASAGTSGGTSGSAGPGQPSTGGTSGGSSGGTSGGSSGGKAFSCSYALVVFTYQGKTYIMKVGQDLSCIGTDQTSSDATFSYTCNGTTYSNPSFTVLADGAPIAPYPGPTACNSLFTITASSATAAPGVTILWGTVHNGSFPNHFGDLCPPAGGASSISFPAICNPNH
jgi:hypothetical protein